MPTYGVTQQIDFCYGHRLLDYEGKCAHLHGHNAVAELTFEAPKLDAQGMVVDFTEIKKRLGQWIQDELDHRMLLHKSDPLVAVLKEANEPVFVMEDPPTAEILAKLLYEKAHSEGLPVVEVKLWETRSQHAVYRG